MIKKESISELHIYKNLTLLQTVLSYINNNAYQKIKNNLNKQHAKLLIWGKKQGYSKLELDQAFIKGRFDKKEIRIRAKFNLAYQSYTQKIQKLCQLIAEDYIKETKLNKSYFLDNEPESKIFIKYYNKKIIIQNNLKLTSQESIKCIIDGLRADQEELNTKIEDLKKIQKFDKNTLYTKRIELKKAKKNIKNDTEFQLIHKSILNRAKIIQRFQVERNSLQNQIDQNKNIIAKIESGDFPNLPSFKTIKEFQKHLAKQYLSIEETLRTIIKRFNTEREQLFMQETNFSLGNFQNKNQIDFKDNIQHAKWSINYDWEQLLNFTTTLNFLKEDIIIINKLKDSYQRKKHKSQQMIRTHRLIQSEYQDLLSKKDKSFTKTINNLSNLTKKDVCLFFKKIMLDLNSLFKVLESTKSQLDWPSFVNIKNKIFGNTNNELLTLILFMQPLKIQDKFNELRICEWEKNETKNQINLNKNFCKKVKNLLSIMLIDLNNRSEKEFNENFQGLIQGGWGDTTGATLKHRLNFENTYEAQEIRQKIRLKYQHIYAWEQFDTQIENDLKLFQEFICDLDVEIVSCKNQITDLQSNINTYKENIRSWKNKKTIQPSSKIKMDHIAKKSKQTLSTFELLASNLSHGVTPKSSDHLDMINIEELFKEINSNTSKTPSNKTISTNLIHIS